LSLEGRRLRLAELVDPAITQLSRRVQDSKPPALALKAATDILDGPATRVRRISILWPRRLL